MSSDFDKEFLVFRAPSIEFGEDADIDTLRGVYRDLREKEWSLVVRMKDGTAKVDAPVDDIDWWDVAKVVIP